MAATSIGQGVFWGGAAGSLHHAPRSFMKTAWPEHLVRSALSLGASEPLFFLTNYAPAGVTDQKEVPGPWAQEAQVNECIFPCKHEKSNLGKASGQPTWPSTSSFSAFLFPMN